MAVPAELLERRIEDLERRLREVAGRLEALESAPGHPAEGARAPAPAAAPHPDAVPAAPVVAAAPAPAIDAAAAGAVDAEAPDDDEAADAPGEPSFWSGVPLLAGRTFLVLAGAFLLRALTGAGTFPEAVGVALGLAYAAAWTVLAFRAGRAGRVVDATMHGVATILVAFPIVWEGSTRFAAFGPDGGAALLAIYALAILAVAWRHGLRVLAFLGVLAAALTAAGLLVAGRTLAPLALVLVPLGPASLAVAWHRGWNELAWPAALVLDGVLGVLAARSGAPAYAWVGASELLAFQAALAGVYLGAFAWRTLVQERSVGAFEVVQSLAVVAAGFEGAVAVAGAGGPGRWILVLVAAGMAAGAHGAAFLRLERREDRIWNVACCTALGSLMAVEALRLALPLPVAGVLWTALALALAIPGVRADRVALRLQAAALVVAGALSTGLLPESLAVLASRDVPEAPPGAAGLACLGLAVAVLVVLRRHRVPGDRRWHWTVPGVAIASVAALGAAGAAAGLLAAGLAGEGAAADLGVLAVLRTAVLSAVALLCALLGRGRRRREFRWTAWLVLALTAVKVAVEDVPRGRPLTLFLTLSLFGGALVVASRIVRRRPSPRPPVTTP